MILRIFTQIHVLISLIGIFTGLVVLLGMLTGKRLDGWTKWFLTTTVLTSVTGFFFPLDRAGISSSSVRTAKRNFSRSCWANALTCLSDSTALMAEL